MNIFSHEELQRIFKPWREAHSKALCAALARIMKKTDLEKAQELWQILVMLKREMDEHIVHPGSKYELPKRAWQEAVRRAELVNPNPPHSAEGLQPSQYD